MARVALVTGGTRGIGEAISTALHDAGRTVVASYVGNDAAAKSFSEATGIAVIKFDAGDFASCEAAVKTIAERARAGRDPGQQRRHHARRHDGQDEP